MTPQYVDLWERAIEAIAAARAVVDVSPDAVASRCYYAAFYAASAHFAIEDTFYRKHSAVEVAVHRDLVKTGRIPAETGSLYSQLLTLRGVGDYGAYQHVGPQEAREAIDMAVSILSAIRSLNSDKLRAPDS